MSALSGPCFVGENAIPFGDKRQNQLSLGGHNVFWIYPRPLCATIFNKLAKFHENVLSLSENIAKSFMGLLF